MATKELKEIIWYDEAEHQRFEKLQQELKVVLKALKSIHLEALGTDLISDYKAYLDGSVNYLVDAYYLINKKFYPPTVDKRKIFRQSTIDITEVERLNKQIKDLQKQLVTYQAVVNESGISYKVKKSNHEYYLDESKEKHYRALQRFLKAVEDLKTYENINIAGVIRTSTNIAPNGIEPAIVTGNFYNDN